MASGALFGNASGRSASKNLVEFRAGKMYLKGKMVNPDKRKGLVYIYQSDDSLMHFCWKDRTKGTVEDDLIIFPDDCEFKHIKQCNTGRVYLLRFKSTSRKFFFWMQEPKVDQDDELCKTVNDNLNSPPTPGASRGGSAGPLGGLPPEVAAGLGEADLQNLLGNMNQQQLMQLLGGMGMGGLGGLSALMGARPSSSSQSESTPPSRVQSSPGPRPGTESTPQAARPITAAELSSQTQTPVAPPPNTTPAAPSHPTQPATTTSSTVATSATGATSPQIQLSDLQNILSGLGGDAGNEERRPEIDLSSALTPETMIPILANADVQERLIPFLPEGESLPKTEEELRNTVSSPQFQQAMSSFSAALASGQLGPLMGQFELGDDVSAAAAQGDVSAFVTAMQANLAKKKEKEEKKEEKETNEKEEKKEEK